MAEYIYEVDDFRIVRKKELVRCKECKYQRWNIEHQYLYCAFSKDFPIGEDDDWCSMAERKDNG